MSIQTYETLFLLDSTKLSSDAEATKQQIHHIIERLGGQVVISRPWDYTHKLSYPIGKQKKGGFHILYYTLESTKQVELEREFALQEGLILRQLTLKLDPKWQDIILQVAREEQSNGFAVRGMQDEAAVTTDPTAIGEGLDGDIPSPPREGGRRRRSEMVEKPE